MLWKASTQWTIRQFFHGVRLGWATGACFFGALLALPSLVRILGFFLVYFSFLTAQGNTLDCLQGLSPKAELRAVGVETINVNASVVSTIWLPMPKSSNKRILDLNSMGFNTAYPSDFAISDGTLVSAFASVDLRAGSTLDRCLNEMAASVRRQAPTIERQIFLLKDFIGFYLEHVPDDFLFPWSLQHEPRLPSQFYEARGLPAGHFPLLTNMRHPIIPLESYLWARRGACQVKALLTSLLMKKLGILHQMRSGFSEWSGHAWIELPDGRHLDPTWQILDYPHTDGAWPGWFRVDQTFLTRNQVFPFAAEP